MTKETKAPNKAWELMKILGIGFLMILMSTVSKTIAELFKEAQLLYPKVIMQPIIFTFDALGMGMLIIGLGFIFVLGVGLFISNKQ